MEAKQARSGRTSRTRRDGVVEDRCDRCETFRPRAMFTPGGSAICRECRASRRPAQLGPLAPSGLGASSPTSWASGSRPAAPAEYTLSRGRYAGVRLREAPLGYLRACIAPRPDSTNPARTHIRWSADVRMIRRYLEQLDTQPREIVDDADAGTVATHVSSGTRTTAT